MRNLFDNPFLLIVLVLLIVVVFGAKRLPDAARSLGRSMRIFKAEVKEMKDDDRPAGASPHPLEGRVLDDGPRVDRTFDPRVDGRADAHVERPGEAGTGQRSGA